jgi:hypothetical protein
MKYNPHIYESTATIKIRVYASNPNHALQRMKELFKNKTITQYKPEAVNTASVIGVVERYDISEPKQVKFDEGNPIRSPEHSEEKS